mmetsp:Transcript_6106/g.12443  ORF Transcript_6106/g.12443 Transcript_6106/m.12443 type:complete len:106 (+) Transcript_6106:198-515(+)
MPRSSSSMSRRGLLRETQQSLRSPGAEERSLRASAAAYFAGASRPARPRRPSSPDRLRRERVGRMASAGGAGGDEAPSPWSPRLELQSSSFRRKDLITSASPEPQ